MYLFRGVFCLLCATMLAVACSTPSPTTDSAVAEAPSLYPAWYSPSGFSADSTSFNAFASAIDSDSIGALNKAEEQARVQLDRQLGTQFEEIRSSLQEQGNSDVTNTDYYIILQEAQEALPANASVEVRDVRRAKGSESYRAFVGLKLDKQVARKLLEDGFTGHPRYWATLSGSEAFASLFD